MRKTVANWNELCELIRQYKKEGKTITLKPISWYGEMKKDRKTKMVTQEVDKVYSIIFDVDTKDQSFPK
jgi:hypothetical protein